MAPTFPPIYLLKWNLEHDPKELHRLEEEIDVVFDIKEAKLVLGKVKLKRRAALELRKLGLDTEEVVTVQGAGERCKPTHGWKSMPEEAPQDR
jgi:DNA polymerase IV